ncbi:winged helix-turn-helix domain-containing protein [Lysobacter firmicutimachus]|uniref:Winged helix-turn-helix domain-containing protein n=1 Tax=Lysobacter firmicutimachus TaxID=1792846 RepID=A0AAU8MZ50_9GAMM
MTTPWPAEARYLQLVDVTVDLRFRRLILADRSLELPQRVFDLMLLFLGEPHKLHTRATLFDRLWAGTVVEDTNLSQNVWLLRKALGEERKAWIRTVAKSGYVFEPPGPIRWFERLPAASPPTRATAPPVVERDTAPEAGLAIDTASPVADASGDTLAARAAEADRSGQAALPTSNPEAERPAARPDRRRRYVGLAAVLALIAVATASLMVWRHAQPRNAGSVALVMVEDGSGSSWPAKLLQQWLAWKLDSLPEANVLREGDVASGIGTAPIDVVFLSSVRSSDDPTKWELHARLIHGGKEERISATGNPADMPALVDSLSRRIVARLLPERAAPWPTLEASADAAQRYEGFARALDRRDWMTASRLGAEIVRLAPRFALVRLQLADALSQLSQATAAREQQRVAAQLLQGSPTEAVASLEARQQAMEIGGAGKALVLYQALVDRYPDKTGYRLKLAELLILAGQYERALTHLADAPGRSEALGVRIAKRLLRAQAYGHLGDPARMRAMALQAQQLARSAGDGWASEQASAWILRGKADDFQDPERKSASAFEQAATLYRLAGDTTGELYASYLARTADPPGPATDAELDVLLARANAGGHRRLEVAILLANADQHSIAGDAESYRSRLLQASATATAAGDPVLMGAVNTRLLNIEILTARFDSADEMARRQRRLDLRGTARLFSDQFAAALALIRGDAQRALDIVEASERLLPQAVPGQRESEALAQIACVRTDLLLSLGRMAEARKALERCRQGERWAVQFYAPAVGSYMELAAGDLPRARALLHQAEASMAKMTPDRWLNAIEVARIATRLGELERSERIYAEVLPAVSSVGYTLLTALVLTGKAENAAARGDWENSRRFASEARQAIPDNAWGIVSRLDLLAAIDARQRGDAVAASALAGRLHRRARELGDVVAELESHPLFEPDALDGDCGLAERESLVARTGMRGVRLDWLLGTGGAPRAAVVR